MTLTRVVHLACWLILVLAAPALAYVGPGAGLTVIGAALAFVAGIVLAVFGFIWYPLKRLARAMGARRARTAEPRAEKLSA